MNISRLFAALAIPLLFAACAAQPINPALKSAQADYNEARNMKDIMNYGGAEMANAKAALDAGYQASTTVRVEHHALIASKNVEIAKERLQIAKNREAIGDAKLRRQELRLKAKSAELSETTAELQARERELLAAQARAEAAEDAAMTLAAELEALNALQSERGIVLTLKDISFDLDKATLRSGGERAVAKVAAFLVDHPDRAVVVEGFTDSQGSASYNKDLSQRRADSVRNGLIANGVAAERILTKAFGESYPVATNKTREGRAQNRRVEIVIANQDNVAVPAR